MRQEPISLQGEEVDAEDEAVLQVPGTGLREAGQLAQGDVPDILMIVGDVRLCCQRLHEVGVAWDLLGSSSLIPAGVGGRCSGILTYSH